MASQNGDAYDGATAVGDAPMHATSATAQNSSARPFDAQAGHRSFSSSTSYAKGKTNENTFNKHAGKVLRGPSYQIDNGGGGGDPSSSQHGIMHAEDLPFVDSSAYLDVKRPFMVPIKDNVRNALLELNQELIKEGRSPLISKKKPGQLLGREVYSGSFGLYEYGSQPQILLEPGRYPPMPLANWIGCTYHGTYDLASNFPPLKGQSEAISVPDQKLAKLGLTIVQVSQNQAAVCLDPQNRVFVVNEGGFVAMATSGAYRLLALVDQTHLEKKITDRYSKQVLGHTQTVKLPGGYVAATFLDIPANNVVILQRKDEMYVLGAGQHYLTTSSVTIRNVFTCAEVQQELEVDNIYTRDQVPVYLRMFLRYQLISPLSLARHGYETPFDALQDKTRSILTQVLAHLDYSAMARSRNAAPDAIVDSQHDDDGSNIFVSAVRTQAIDELKVAAAIYGIQLEDLAIIDRAFKGEIASRMDSLTTRGLEAQVESANLDRENANRRRKQEGDAKVLELQNTMKRATAETDASNVIAQARARAEANLIEAEARAKAIRLTAQADADAIRIKADADAAIADVFAQGQARSRIEVDRTKAYGNNTIFAPLEALNSGGVAFASLMAGNPNSKAMTKA